MINMVLADLKRILLGKAIYQGIAFMFVFMFFMLVVVDQRPGELSPLYDAFNRGEITTTMILRANISFIGFLAVMSMLVIVGDDFKEGTIKNTICVGVSRTQFYFAKLTLAIILAVLIFFTYHIGGAGFLTFASGIYFNYTFSDLLATIPAFAIQLFLFLACTSLGVCILFIVKKVELVFLFLLIIQVPIILVAMLRNLIPPITHLLYIDINNAMSTLAFADFPASEIYRLLIIGTVYFIISTALGLFFFNRRDIK